MAEATIETKTVSKTKKLVKDIKTKFPLLTISVVGGKKGTMEFDYRTCPDNIKAHLPVLGLSHRLGDAAAGKSGIDAEEAILKVWKGLKEGDLAVRAPAAPKVSMAELKAKLAAMSEPERKATLKALENVGMDISLLK